MADISLFANNFIRLRDSKRMTQRELAPHLHVTKSTVGKWETSKTLPPMDTLERVADYFDVEVYELFIPIRNGKPVTEANLYTMAISMLARTEAAINALTKSLADIPEEDYERQVIRNDIAMKRDEYLHEREFVGELFGKTKLEVAQDVAALAEPDEPPHL